MTAVEIRRAEAADLLALQRQPSQRVQLGLALELDLDTARAMIAPGEAWTAWRDGAPIACIGLRETFPGAQAVAWGLLAADLGAAHLAVSRHARERIAASGLARIEAIVRSSADAEAILANFPELDGHQLLAALLAIERGAEARWAAVLGLRPAAVLRRFGAASETHILFERIR